MSQMMKLAAMIALVFVLCQTDAAAVNRLLHEDFDDMVLDGRLVVCDQHWTRLSPPQYNLTAVGRDGSGRCFSSGTVNEAFLFWNRNIPSPWPSDSLYVSFWMRYPKYVTTDPANEDFKIFYPCWNGTDSYVHYTLAQPDLIYYSAKARGKMVAWSRWLDCPNMTDGKWHHYEFYIKFSKGISQFRYDGELKVDDEYGYGRWTNAVHAISLPSVDAGGPGVFSRQVDDLEVWDGMPDFDVNPPFITNMSPAERVKGIPAGTGLTVHVQDMESGVNRASISMKINGVRVRPVVSGSPEDYVLYYKPPAGFIRGTKIQVMIEAEDLEGNMGTDGYWFMVSR